MKLAAFVVLLVACKQEKPDLRTELIKQALENYGMSSPALVTSATCKAGDRPCWQLAYRPFAFDNRPSREDLRQACPADDSACFGVFFDAIEQEKAMLRRFGVDVSDYDVYKKYAAQELKAANASTGVTHNVEVVDFDKSGLAADVDAAFRAINPPTQKK